MTWRSLNCSTNQNPLKIPYCSPETSLCKPHPPTNPPLLPMILVDNACIVHMVTSRRHHLRSVWLTEGPSADRQQEDGRYTWFWSWLPWQRGPRGPVVFALHTAVWLGGAGESGEWGVKRWEMGTNVNNFTQAVPSSTSHRDKDRDSLQQLRGVAEMP